MAGYEKFNLHLNIHLILSFKFVLYFLILLLRLKN